MNYLKINTGDKEHARKYLNVRYDKYENNIGYSLIFTLIRISKRADYHSPRITRGFTHEGFRRLDGEKGLLIL